MDIPWFRADPQPARMHYLCAEADFNAARPAAFRWPPVQGWTRRQGHRGSREYLCGHEHGLPKAGNLEAGSGTDGNRLGVNVEGIVLLAFTLLDGNPGTHQYGTSCKNATM
ncbi:hypothetical protein B0E47_03325 [Rhodanobacter sp. B05]|nr:hypothetical protein B0E47_03325 [Rhodanobacter sp. B05]